MQNKSSVTAQRLDREMQNVVQCVQRELIRAGIVVGPERKKWRLIEDGFEVMAAQPWPAAPHALDAWLERVDRATAVCYSGVAVQATFQALSSPAPREHVLQHSAGLELVVRRPPSRWSRYAPLGHFCVRLREDKLSLRDIAEVLGELAPRESYRSRHRWDEAVDSAARRIGKRIQRFEALNPR